MARVESIGRIVMPAAKPRGFFASISEANVGAIVLIAIACAVGRRSIARS